MNARRPRVFIVVRSNIHSVYPDNIAVTAQRIIFSDTLYRFLENTALEKHPGIYFRVHLKHRELSHRQLIMTGKEICFERPQCTVNIVEVNTSCNLIK